MPYERTGKPPGRPRGSRNKATVARISRSAPKKTKTQGAVIVNDAPPPDGTASLITYHQARLRQVAADLAHARATDALPSDLAMLIRQEAAILRQLAELTGATRLDEAMVYASDVWKALYATLTTALVRHPDALRAIREALPPAATPRS